MIAAMDRPPALPPVDPPPLPVGTPAPATSIAWCWMVIVLSVAAVFASVMVEKSTARVDAKPSAPSPQELFSARYALGLRLLGDQSTGATDRRLVEQLREQARTPAERLRAAIVMAEVLSLEQARAALQDASVDAPEEIQQDVAVVRALFESDQIPTQGPDHRSLIERHGWFGRLAMVRTLGPDDPQRREVLASAKRTLWVGIGLGFGLIGLLVGGLALAIVGIILLATGVIRIPRTPPGRSHPVILESFTIYLATFGVAATWGLLGLPGDSAVSFVGLMIGVTLGLLWPSFRGLPWADFRTAIGLNRGRGVFIESLLGVAGYLALLPVVAIGFTLTWLLTRSTQADAMHPIVELLSGPAIVLMFIFLLAVVFAPITEEIFFRGALFGHVRGWLAWPAAALLVGLIFAAIHPQGFAGIPVLAAIGFNMAVLRQWRGTLIAPIAAHAFNNAVALTVGIMLLR